MREKVGSSVPRRTSEGFIEIARKLESGIGILLIREAFFLPGMFPSTSKTVTSRVALEEVKLVKPRIVVGNACATATTNRVSSPEGRCTCA